MRSDLWVRFPFFNFFSLTFSDRPRMSGTTVKRTRPEVVTTGKDVSWGNWQCYQICCACNLLNKFRGFFSVPRCQLLSTPPAKVYSIEHLISTLCVIIRFTHGEQDQYYNVPMPFFSVHNNARGICMAIFIRWHNKYQLTAAFCAYLCNLLY